MSLDIDWSLLSLSSPDAGPSTSTLDGPRPLPSRSPSTFSAADTLPDGLDPTPALSESLIASLNEHLSSASRPSFIGPIVITSFDFGSVGPEVEITDIRDVWRAFDEGDDEAEGEDARQAAAVSGADDIPDGYGGHDYYDHEVLYEEEDGDDDEVYGGASALRYGRRTGAGAGRSLIAGRSDGSVAGRGGPSQRRSRPTALGLSRRDTADSQLDDEAYDLVSPLEARGLYQHQQQYYARGHGGAAMDPEEYLDDDGGDNVSVFSGMSPRNSVVAVGIGVGGNTLPLGALGAGGRAGGGSAAAAIAAAAAAGGAIDPSLFSAPLSSRIHPSVSRQHHPSHQYHSQRSGRGPLQYSAAIRDRERLAYRHSPISSPPPSPPARPPGGPVSGSSGDGASSVPSLQLHLRVAHKSDLHLTLLTSLQVNYPSPLFMSLPLKLSITGLALNADLVLAYSGARNRVHVTIIDEDGSGGGGGGDQPPNHSSTHASRHGHNHPHQYLDGSGRPKAQIPIGERLLPNLQIESEIGHSDAHVLRNVGKVERFIVEAVRKTLVDELVFPNFQTIAL